MSYSTQGNRMKALFDHFAILCVIGVYGFARAMGITHSVFCHRLHKGTLPDSDVRIGYRGDYWLLNTAARYIPIGGPTQLVNTDPHNPKILPIDPRVRAFLPCSNPVILGDLNEVEILRTVDEHMIGRATNLRGATLRQLIAENLFPAPNVHVTGRRPCWELDELLEWMRNQEPVRPSDGRYRWLYGMAGGTDDLLHN